MMQHQIHRWSGRVCHRVPFLDFYINYVIENISSSIKPLADDIVQFHRDIEILECWSKK